jgi:hypothetical protein
MSLPTISIPEIPIPFEIPAFLNDYLGHFIIAIPVILLLLEVYNLITKRPSISLFSLLMLILLSLILIVFYLQESATGNSSHKLLTVYLVYASLGLILFKLLFMALRKLFGRIIFILMLAGFAFVILMQVNSGGVFSVKEVSVDTHLQDELTKKLKELQSKYDTLLLVEEKKSEPAPAVVEPVKEEKVVEATTMSTESEENNSSN